MRAVIVAVIAAAMLVLPGVAAAGQYEVHSCRLPDGTAVGLVGWLPNGPVDPFFGRSDGCGTGSGYFEATMRPDATHTGNAGRGWDLDLIGTGVSLRRLRARVAMTTRPSGGILGNVVDAIAWNGQGNFSITNGASRGNPWRWDDPANEIDTGTITPASGYRFGVRCSDGSGTCPFQSGVEPKAFIRVFRTEVTLEDLVDPEVSSFTGAIAAAGVHRGVESFVLRASDRGAGVYRLLVQLDGHEVLRVPIDENAGQCTDQVPGGGDYDFIAPIPCKADVDGSFELDTTQIPDGRYRARFAVEDAAGNERVAVAAIDGWTVNNAPPPPPPPPAPLATSAPADSHTKAELLLGCGRRALSLISAHASGASVRLTGVVAAGHRGSRIAIYDSGRRIATTTARADGFFDAYVPRPSRRRFARARFQAGVAGVRSVALKLPQDLATSSLSLRGARTIEIAGAVRRRGYRSVVVRRITCGRYSTVASGATDGRGHYRLRFAAPRAAAGLYRVETRVGGKLAYARAKAIDLGDPGSG